MSTEFTNEDVEFVYGALFETKSPYKRIKVKEHLATVSRLGIMSRPGKVEVIKGSVNFGKSVALTKRERGPIFKKPTETARDGEIDTTPIPKTAYTAQIEYDFSRVVRKGRRGAYTIPELTFWYEHFTGEKLPTKYMNRDTLVTLHEQLPINKGKGQ